MCFPDSWPLSLSCLIIKRLLLKKEHIQDLLHKYEQGICTEEENIALQQWLDDLAGQAGEYVFAPDEKQRVKRRLLASVLKRGSHGSENVLLIRIRQAMAAAAVITMAAVSWWWFHQPHVIKVRSGNEVARVVLPDSSVIWLNKNAEIAYNKAFTQHRYVQLQQGEAFFDVKKDTAHPFTIQSGAVTTTVKGTSFSVTKDYYNNGIKVAVLTGRVAVSSGKDTMAVLTPGWRIRYVPGVSTVLEDAIQPASINGWIHGETVLQQATVKEVASWLHTSFNVQVNNRNDKYTGNYYLSFKKGITLPEALRIINLVSAGQHAHFSLHHNVVTIE